MEREYEANAKQWASEGAGKPPRDKAFTITDSGCWEWNGFVNELGYGYVWGMSAHRLMYSYYKQSIPQGMVLLHSCDNRKCVNPDHLTPGTQRANVADMYAKGRARPWGRDQKLTPEQRSEIETRCQAGENPQSLADAFGVSAGYVRSIGGTPPDTRNRSAPVKLNDQQCRTIARRYHDGESGVLLADEFGIPRSRVNQIHNRYYPQDQPRTPTRNPESTPLYDAQRALSLRNLGWSHQQIAEELGCAKSTVARLITRAVREADPNDS